MNDVYLGLGSNLNQPTKQIRQAITHISRLGRTQVVDIAPLFESKPWGVKNQANFINTAIKVHTALKPLALLKAIKIVEYRMMQRPHNHKWHERTIDIDILLYGKHQIERPTLKVPHPLMTERCFVMVPLMHLKPTLPKRLKHNIQQHLKQHDCDSELTQISVKLTKQKLT